MRVLTDCWVMAWRNLVAVRRSPDIITAAVIQPIMFVLLFSYVLAGTLGGDGYREYVMAGIFVQAVAFNSSFTTVGLATDLHRGVIDRFRVLPMSRIAVVVGRTCSDLLINAAGLVVMTLCGLAVGWRIHGGVLRAVTAYGLLLLFTFAMCWVGALIGLAVPSVEAAESAGLILKIPLTFVSSAFLAVPTMPAPFRVFAEWNPLSTVSEACRHLFGNPPPAAIPVSGGWSAEHAVSYSALVCALLVIVFMTLSFHRYNRATRP